ncbi:MAG TPA: DHHA1 domain-containing protein, partial [Smithellaceae bacterium]|nr:DHHA1 domain-containing protein [Smithellaceae bacterium]
EFEEQLKKTAALFKANPLEITERVEKTLKHIKELEKEIEALQGKMAARDSGDLLSQLKEINGIKVLAAEVNISDVKMLRDFGDKLRDKLASGVILLGAKTGDKAMLLCMVTKDLTSRFHAGNIIKEIAPLIGGSGGGRPDMAQAGGTKPENLAQAIVQLEKILAK